MLTKIHVYIKTYIILEVFVRSVIKLGIGGVTGLLGKFAVSAHVETPSAVLSATANLGNNKE
jgi:hypothetical protein